MSNYVYVNTLPRYARDGALCNVSSTARSKMQTLKRNSTNGRKRSEIRISAMSFAPELLMRMQRGVTNVRPGWPEHVLLLDGIMYIDTCHPYFSKDI